MHFNYLDMNFCMDIHHSIKFYFICIESLTICFLYNKLFQLRLTDDNLNISGNYLVL